MADYFELEASRTGNFPDTPTDNGISTLGASVINANYREFYHLVFENPTRYLQTWHLDGYNFFVVGWGLILMLHVLVRFSEPFMSGICLFWSIYSTSIKFVNANCSMEFGTSSWEEDMKATYNLNDAVSRSTVQVCWLAYHWTPIIDQGCETICLTLFSSQICDHHLTGLSIRMDGSDGHAGQSRVVESEITGCGEMVSRARVVRASQRHWRGGSINHSC